MRFTSALVGIVLVALAAPATAEESPLYGGLRIGSVAADFAGFGKATNLGIVLGDDLSRDQDGALALETEFTTTLSDGSVAGGGKWDADTIAAYAAYRTAGSAFVKAKLGFLHQDIDRSGGPVNADDSGIAYGAGVGVRLSGKATLEVEYTRMSSDLGFLSLAYLTHF
ncbi:MAG TPA: outer membrane beta-barrel protein [Burkholderiales bacterium]